MVSIISQVPILILISFDGFRHDYLHQSTAPNLFDLTPYATLGHMRSLYVTKTFPNHFSIATGLYEDEHEIINNKMYDPILKERFQQSNVEKKWWDPKDKVTPIWTANKLYGGEKRNSASMMYPGSVTPYHDIVPRHLKEFNRNRNWTSNVETVIGWLTDKEHPANFVSMYFDEPDSTSHTYGPFSPKTLAQVRKVDSAAGYLVKRLRDVGLFDQANMIFLSDHGMAQLNKTEYLEDYVDTKFFDMFGASPTWSLFVRPEYLSIKTKVYRMLKEASEKGHFTVYKRRSIPAEFHYSKSLRIGDFFIISNEGYDLYPNSTYAASTEKKWGNHGWNPTNEDMRPLFMAIGPRFKKDYYHDIIFPNIDLFPLMCNILDLPLQKLPSNGSLLHVADMLSATEKSVGDELVKFIFLILCGFAILVTGGILFTLFARYKRPKARPDPDTSSLGPGLNIDLEFYLANTPSGFRLDEHMKKIKSKKNEENHKHTPTQT